MNNARWAISLFTGVIMFGIGAYVAARPLWSHGLPITGARWLDAAFAIVFMLRGVINVRTALSRRRAMAQG